MVDDSAMAVAVLFVGVGQFRDDIGYREDRGWRLEDSARQLEVAAFIKVFLFFLALIPVRLKKDWRSHGAYAA